jgi:transposase
MSTIQRAHKTELALNNEQITGCREHAGAAHWAYNRGLQRKQEVYRATGKSPSAIDLYRELNVLKQTQVPWMYKVSRRAPQEALRNLDTAFARFFRRAQLKKAGKHRGQLGYPQFKTKKRGLGSFRLTGSIVVFPDAIHLPRLGRLRLKERGYLPTAAKILSATVSEYAGHWYVSLLVEQEQTVLANAGAVVGVDLGVKVLARLAGRVFQCRNPQRPDCGLALDHDPNAELNLAKLAGSSSDNANACGEGCAGGSRVVPVKLPSLKQEPDTL